MFTNTYELLRWMNLVAYRINAEYENKDFQYSNLAVLTKKEIEFIVYILRLSILIVRIHL